MNRDVVGRRTPRKERAVRVWRRVRQFLRSLYPRVRAEEYALVEARLPPAAATLFRRMDRCDQRHCLDVFRTLREAGYDDEALLCAALIHDVGKIDGRLTVAHRVAVVLLERWAPRWLARLAGEGRGWRAPFAAHVRHARVGARRAAAAGCAPATVAAIAGHHAAPTIRSARAAASERAAALRWADERN